MRLWAAAPRDEILAIARRLFGDGELRAPGRRRVAGDRARRRLPQPVRRLRGGGDGARADVRRRAAARLGVDVRGGLAAARAAAAVDRVRSPTPCSTRAPRSTSGAARCTCTCTPPPTAWSAACSSRTSPTRPREDAWRSATGSRRPSASSPPGGSTAIGRLAATAASTTQALEAFLTTGRRLERAAGDQSRRCCRGARRRGWRRSGSAATSRRATLVAEELALAERFGAPRAIGVALPRGRAARARRRGRRAAALRRRACSPAAAPGSSRRAALIELGAAIRRAGRPVEARGTLREALVLAEATGATALARRAREELRLAGGRAPAPVDPSGDGLTPSERRVAELAARRPDQPRRSPTRCSSPSRASSGTSATSTASSTSAAAASSPPRSTPG